MRRRLGHTLVATGMALLTLAALAPTYIYSAIAVIPPDAKFTVVAESSKGESATYFDVPNLKQASAPLKSITEIRGDPNATKQARKELGRDVVVWGAYACAGLATQNCTTAEWPLTGSRTLLALDAHTGEVVHWDGAYLETLGERNDRPRVTGSVYKLPFHVQKKTYAWWNSDLGGVADLRYEGVTTVKGLAVYRFLQTVPPTKVGTTKIPGSLAGSNAPSVGAEQMVSSRLEATVEPETGVIVTRKLTVDKYFTVNGRRVVTATRGSFVVTDDSVSDTIHTYRPLARALFLLRVGVPAGASLLALVLLAAGITLVRRSNTAVAASTVGSHHEA